MSKNIYICLPVISPDVKKTRRILSDLGKPTKRGIRKCPNCGTYNGTRGVSCKNKYCNAVFKESSEKRKVNLEAIKLVTATARKVYSVRVRDGGPYCRGFVQLPPVQSAIEPKEQNVLSQMALCFVDSCQKLFDISILKCHESEQESVSSTCIHIESAIKSASTGTPLKFKLDVVNLLNVSEQLKNTLWMSASETKDPLVQRVSKSVMAVKCQVSPKHPLGYLHFTFYTTRGKEMFDKFFCECHEFSGRNDCAEQKKKCVHYYICLVALASDERFTSEFLNIVNQEINVSSLLQCSVSRRSLPAKNTFRLEDNKRKMQADNCKVKSKRTQVQIDDSWHFIEWLSSVTEKINQRLTIVSCSSQELLKFHIPMKFFNLLKERINSEYIKIEILNNGNKNQAIYKYMWHVANGVRLKQIFDTPQMKLQTRYGSLYFTKQMDICEDDANSSNCNQFIIEWTPNTSSLMEFGQLTLQFNTVCQISNINYNI